MSNRSLETKIIFTLGLVLVVTLSVYAYFDMSYEREATYKMAYQQLEALTNTIQKSLIKDMRSGRGADVQEILEIVGTEPGILGVRIFDQDGRVLKSGKRTEVGTMVAAETMREYREGSRDFLTSQDGENVIHIVHPIANAPQCNQCHGVEKEIIGVLMLDYSLVKVQGYIGAHARRLVAALGLTVILSGLAIFLMLKKMVNNPIGRLQGAMAEVERGNLDIRIDVASGDEIGSLQQSFNSMISKMKELNVKTLSQQKDIIEKEQELKLTERLSEKNAELESANREAVEKNRYYMEMLSFISHELKNPLVVLKGYTTLLADGDLEELREPQLEAVRAMERNVDALNEMIANYMDLSRLERGELIPQKRRFAVVEELIRPLMYEYSDLLSKSSMSMRIECVDDSLTMVADPGLMRSVLANLVSNAIKYGRQGSDIMVEVERNGDEVSLSVFNEGRGIPARDLDRVFGRFSRLENEVTRSQKGTGLGLYLVKVIVGLHGGSVSAESKEGEWARMVCTMPLELTEA